MKEKIEIVLHSNNSYSVRKTIHHLFKQPTYLFLDRESGIWWGIEKIKYCTFATIEEAKNRIDIGKPIE
jgi:hypothetical protein